MISKPYFFLCILFSISIYPTYSLASSCDMSVQSQEELDDLIKSEIEQKHKSAIDVRLTSNNDFFIKDEICITSINVDDFGYTFRVGLKIDNKNALYQGKFAFNYLVPALQTQLSAGTVVRESDIYFISYPSQKVNNNLIKTKEELVGKALRTSTNADKPLNIRDVYVPLLIHKNESVNVVYEKGNISIKVTALALENGSMNDMIKLKNTRSGNIFTAKVSGEKTAIIY
ncbi:MAG: flagellar basal body P-ring formation protein FlgA [Alphaproteobacteria bacterium]|nr:flagellar basal body P-ring formation protein FlgA [Alphaproteobacteria bacterium]OJV16022.1 MAG: flagella basal body P-ring formation protein FlgA [Alphaproteobacteria bacterium 33-17]